MRVELIEKVYTDYNEGKIDLLTAVLRFSSFGCNFSPKLLTDDPLQFGETPLFNAKKNIPENGELFVFGKPVKSKAMRYDPKDFKPQEVEGYYYVIPLLRLPDYNYVELPVVFWV